MVLRLLMYLEGVWSCRYDLWDGKYLVHHRHHGGEVLGPLVRHQGEESQVSRGSNKKIFKVRKMDQF